MPSKDCFIHTVYTKMSLNLNLFHAYALFNMYLVYPGIFLFWNFFGQIFKIRHILTEVYLIFFSYETISPI